MAGELAGEKTYSLKREKEEASMQPGLIPERPN